MLMIDQLSNDPDSSSLIETFNMMFKSWEISYGDIKQTNTAFIPASIARTSGVYTKTEGNLLREEFDYHNHSYNSLTGKPFYTTTKTILPKKDYTFDTATGEMIMDATFNFVEGETYQIVWNGVSSYCVAQVINSAYDETL
jgi:hypothetical protein